MTRNQAIFTIGLIWILALTLLIPWAVVFEVTSSEEYGIALCIEMWENDFHAKVYFVLANFICCYCLPLVLICITNLVIWRHVSNRKVPHNSASSKSIQNMHRKAKHGVIKMLAIVTLLFCLSWLPLYIIVMRNRLADELSDWESNLLDSLMPFAQWLGSWNSSINPIIYAFLNKKFRQMFESLLPTWMPFVQKRIFIRRTSNFKATSKNNKTQGSTGAPDSNILSGTTQSNIKRYHACRPENETTCTENLGKTTSEVKDTWNTNQTQSHGNVKSESNEIYVISEFVVLTCTGNAVEL